MGTEINIFDTSNYGSVEVRNYLGRDRGSTTEQMTGKVKNLDASVSMCEMEDSMAFEEPKLKHRLINATESNTSPSISAAQFGNGGEIVRASSEHYMAVLE